MLRDYRTKFGRMRSAAAAHQADWPAIMREFWTVVRYRQRKAPRRQWRAVIKVDGKRRRVASDHWPTDNPTNARAHRESLLAAKQFLSRGKSLLDGDLNIMT